MRCLLLEASSLRCLQVRDWAKAVFPTIPQVAETLHEQQVDGEDVLDLTYERLVAEPYKIAAGPAGKLAKRISALSAPPTAASGFQVGASAERDWRGALGSLGKFVRTTRTPRSSSGSWPTLRHRTWVKAAWGLWGE